MFKIENNFKFFYFNQTNEGGEWKEENRVKERKKRSFHYFRMEFTHNRERKRLCINVYIYIKQRIKLVTIGNHQLSILNT